MSAIRTDIPARLDRLPWSAWHWRVVIALGVTWLLDGLEVTVVGSLGPALQRPETLGLSAKPDRLGGSAYIAGAVLGALFFGRLVDTLGRKRIFLVTLAVYLVATMATAFTWDIASFAFCRFVTGFGIGGEYAAINSAIDELIPARVRGRVALAINGTFWVGAAMGAGLSILLLDPAARGSRVRLAHRIRAGRHPRLRHPARAAQRPGEPALAPHARPARRGRGGGPQIEQEVGVKHEKGEHLAPCDRCARCRGATCCTCSRCATTGARSSGSRLMTSQAFFYNAIFFTYALVLARFYGVPDERVGYYIFPFALGNFLGPLLLGHLFDHVGRRVMIATTYGLAGLGLLATGYAFQQEWLSATGQALAWSAIFFVASAAASSAYLTVSEVFPLEMRAIAISLFYALGTALGGFLGPPLYGAMIESGSRSRSSAPTPSPRC